MKVGSIEQGFTLLELMIVVAIIGILASIAYPSYQESVASGKRVDAQGHLLSLAQHMERHFTENGSYTTAVLPYDEAPRDGASKNYDLIKTPVSTAASAATAYLLIARPKNSMAGDRCDDMTIDNIGRKVAGDPDCW